ncbi:LysE family translocator [Aestuariibius sp. 2305UL40-4]|uniref:LysE family translocator n=1 Tax=Aestuariibius violaceus TaxID=3234132 RepID=UPI00345EC8D8
MSGADLLLFNLALLASWLSPGPAFLVVTQTTLANGRRAGMAAALGLALTASIWTLAALLGLGILFEVVPWAATALRIAGATYLIWIAIETWRSARAPLTSTPEVQRRALQRGVLVNLGNPKSILFAASVLVVIFPPNLGWLEVATITANHLLLELVLYAALTALLARPAVARGYARLKTAFDRIAAGVMGTLGLRLAFGSDQ